MKDKTLWIIGAGLVLFYFISRQKPGAPKSPTASTGTATAPSVLSDLFKSIPSQNNPWTVDNTPQIVTAAGNAFGSLVKGFGSIFANSKTGNVPVNTSSIGSGNSVDLSNDVSSTDLGPGYSYEFDLNTDDYDWGNTA